MGMVWSAQVEIHFMSSLAWDVLRQHKLRYIFCPRRYRRVLIFTIGDAFCVPAGMVGDYSTHDEMHLCPGWHGRVLFNT